jgi:TonB family protein
MRFCVLQAVLVALLFMSVAFSEERDWEEANALLAKATSLVTFSPDDRPKFHIEANLSIHHTSKGTLTGKYARDYVSPEHWSDQFTMGDYQQQRVRIEKQVWTKKNSDVAPLPVDFFLRALFTTSFQMAQSDVVNQIHNRKIDGVEARCIEFRNNVGRGSTEGELCVDRSAGTIVYWKYGKQEIWYSQYAPFAGRVRPMHFLVAEDSVTLVEASVAYSISNSLSPESFSPLASAEVSDVCSHSRSLLAKSTPEPFFPPGMSRREFRVPVVVVRAEVDENGRVQKAAVIETVHPIVDAAALEAVKVWTFQPRLCDDKPVRTVTRLDVHFR